MRGAAKQPPPVQEPGDWVQRSACRGESNPNLFFPRKDDDIGLAAAKRVCARCPSVRECLDWALENDMSAGVWGGRSEEERKALKRQRSRA